MRLDHIVKLDDFKRCERLQQQVWGFSDLEVVSASNLVAATHAGGMTAGAFDGEELVGFVTAFAAYLPELTPPAGLHSHMLAVRSEYRGRGVGRALKWFQRDWCLRRGLRWMTWTFDPLQAKNARLNLEHLGACAARYRVNEYGELGGGLNAGLPTDRLLALWELEGAKTLTLLAGHGLAPVDMRGLPLALSVTAGEPERAAVLPESGRVGVALPSDLNRLLRNDPALALSWRLAVREVLQHYLERGYTITRFQDGVYILETEPSII